MGGISGKPKRGNACPRLLGTASFARPAPFKAGGDTLEERARLELVRFYLIGCASRRKPSSALEGPREQAMRRGSWIHVSRFPLIPPIHGPFH